MAFDPHLADLMRQALARRQGVAEKGMFGARCWMLNGNLLCGVGADRFLFRVGKAQEPEVLARPGVEPMESAGRRMGGFVWVGADTAIDDGLETWIELAARFTGGLPPK